MKNLIRTIFAALALIFVASCSEKTVEEEQYLDLVPYNIDGIWMLSEWNGSPLAEGTFAYIVFERNNTRFTTYTNIETFVTVVETGTFGIYEDENAIWGYYEYDNERWWEHKYIVSELTSSRMVWTAEDDPSEVRVYVRVDSLPDSVLSSSSDDSAE